MNCPTFDKYYEAAEKLYKGDTTKMLKDWVDHGNKWSAQVREMAGEEIVADLEEEAPEGKINNFINISADKRQNLLNNLDLEKQKYEYLLDKDPENKNLAKRVSFLKKLMADSILISDELVVINYVRYSHASLQKAKARLESLQENISEEDLYPVMRVVDEIKSLDVLKDIEVEFADTEEGRELTRIYNELLNSREKITKMGLDAVRAVLANKLANNTNNIVYVKARREAEKEFNKKNENNPFNSKEEKNQKRREYIEQYVADNAADIKMKSLSYYGKYVREIHSDIGTFEYFSPNASINNALFTSIVNDILIDLEIAKSNAEAEFMPMQEVMENVSKTNSGRTALDLWKPILIKDTKGWRLLNPSAKNSYLRKKSEKEQGNRVADLTSDEVKWEALLNNPEMEKAYNKFLDMLKKSDSNFTNQGKLGLYIPSLEQDVYKKITQKGVGGALSSLKEIFTINEKFQDLIGAETKAYTRMDDKVVMGVPIYLRTKDISDNNRNFDLPTLLMMNMYNSEVFAARLKNKELVDAAMFTVANAKVAYAGFEASRKKVLNKDNRTAFQEDSTDSNLYKRLQDLKESMIFGQGLKAGKTWTNITHKSNMASSIINLSTNLIAGAASFGNNVFQNIESRISDSQEISPKAVGRATKRYMKYMGGQLSDYVEGKSPKSFMSHLYMFYNPGMETFSTKYQSDYKTVLSRHVNIGTLFAAQRASDTPSYSIVMMSFLDSTYATNAKGEYINSEGKPVKNLSEAMTLMQAYEQHFEKTGQTGLPEFVKGNNRTGENNLRNLKRLGRMIQNFSSERFGAYGSLNKSAAGRTVLGSLFYSQRGFLVPILMQKWKGYSVWGDKKYLYDIPLEERHVDETRGITTEGTYVVGIKVMLDILRESYAAGKLLGLLTEGLTSRKKILSNLSSRDLAQFRRMQVEVALLTSLYIIASSLRSGGEDDDNEAMLAAAFYTRRIYAELRSPSSPGEFLRYFQQPTVSSGTLERLMKLNKQALTDLYNLELEKFEAGPYKGEVKLKRNAIKLTPVLNQINRNYDWKRMYDYLDKM